MADWFHLPPSASSDTKIYTGPATVDNLQWQVWMKPRGKTMLNIICIGGGAGGGGGFTAAAAAARGGGGGGGSAGQVRYVGPLALLPDILYIQAGFGGPGAAAGGIGSNGVISYVSIGPDNTVANNILCRSSSATSTGGAAGTGATGGAGGAAATLATIAQQPLSDIGQSAFLAGQIGTAGGAQTGANGAPQALPTTGLVVMGGAGGAGTTSADFAGGGISTNASLISQYASAAPATGSNNGAGGYMLWKPLFSYCGLGGSASNAGIGGFGGNGAYGSGGGGGGGGTTGGSGGDGGAGIVILTAW